MPNTPLPTFGNFELAGIAVLVAALGLWIIYRFLDKLPRPKSKRLTVGHELRLIKLNTLIIFAALFSASWDIWWHRAVGRDSLWELPHIFMYSLATIGIALGIYIWRHTREKLWKKMVLALMIVPLSAPFDNFWHIVFGVEDLSRPISLSWSPPHMALDIAVILVLACLLKALYRHHKVKDQTFFGTLIFGALYVQATFLVMPFHPTEGWGQVWGFWGAGLLASVYIFVLLMAQRWSKSGVAAIMTSIFGLLLMMTAYGKETAPQILLMPHDRGPNWIYLFAYIGTAAFLDYTRFTHNLWARGALAGGIWSLILFGSSSRFFAPEFQYGWPEIIIATVSGLIGGWLAVVLYDYIEKRRR
ncbi:MAG: hypothetical protein HYV13_02840 [Candidatus Doudnabacteria bacterium]|nr:hypothetical protein [Candidatus Doudnabacteria bacterium]